MALRHFALAFATLLIFALIGCGDSSNNSTSNNNTGTGGSTPTTGSSNPGNTGGSTSTSAEYVYAVSPAGNDQSTLTVFQIDLNSGALNQKATATIPVRAAAYVQADSTGQNVFVGGFEAPGTNLDLVKVNPSAGTITPSPGQTFHSAANLQEGDCCPSALTVDPSGSPAFVGGLNDGYVHSYTVDLASGTWTQVNAYRQPDAGGNVYALALDPSGKHIYTSQRSSSFVTAWSVGSGGQLTPLSSSPFQTTGLTSTVSISPDGKWMFVPHYELAAFDIYAINADGSITLKQANIAAGNAPYLAVTDPQERFLYVSNSGAYNGGPVSISAYKFDAAAGTATPVSGSPFSATQAQQIVVDPSGKFLFAPGQHSSSFSIDQTTGALTPISTSLANMGGITIVKQ
jgi:6-phosphogluconolactonase (cycloisomerase 2 family)